MLPAVWISTVATARPLTESRVPSAADFRPIVIPDDAAADPDARDAGFPAAVPVPIIDFTGGGRTFAPRPTPDQSDTARSVAKAVGWRFRSTGHGAGGSATWYCRAGTSACASSYPGGMYAAAGPGLRVGAWRGRVVKVCGGGRASS